MGMETFGGGQYTATALHLRGRAGEEDTTKNTAVT